MTCRALAVADIPPCRRTIGVRCYGWVGYATMVAKLRAMGIRGKLWVLVGLHLLEVCCDQHNPNDFDGKRKFRVVDRDALLAYDTAMRLGSWKGESWKGEGAPR